jgi:hypothetical protein
MERLLVDRGDPFAVAGCREHGQVGLAEAYFAPEEWVVFEAGCVVVPVHWGILDHPSVAVEGSRLAAVLVV